MKRLLSYALPFFLTLVLLVLLGFVGQRVSQEYKSFGNLSQNNMAPDLTELNQRLLTFLNQFDRFRFGDITITRDDVVQSWQQTLQQTITVLDMDNLEKVPEAKSRTEALKKDLLLLESDMAGLYTLTRRDIDRLRGRIAIHVDEIMPLSSLAATIHREDNIRQQKRINTIWQDLKPLVIAIGAILLIILVLLFFGRGEKRRSDNFLTKAIDTMEDGFAVFDNLDNLTLANKVFMDLLTRAKSWGKPGTPFEKWLELGIRHGLFAPEPDWDAWRQEMLGLFHSGGQHQLTLDNGKIIQLTIHKSDDGGRTLTARDVTALKSTSDGLDNANERFKDLANASFEGIAILNGTTIKTANRRLHEMTGFEKLEGKAITAIFDEAVVKKLTSTNIVTGVETPCKSHDDTTFMAEISARVLSLKNKQERVIAIRDITNRKVMEDDLRKAKESAETGSRIKTDFLAMMSHEIRTPMNGVLGMVNLLLETNLNDRQQGFANTIKDSAEGLLVILNDVLDLSKLDASKIVLEDIAFSPKDLLDAAANLMRAKAKERGLRLNTIVGDDVPHAVKGDPTRIRQILFNLLGNALKFTHQGEVTMSVDLMPGDEGIRFAVTDTGIGIPDAMQAGIFEPFTQADATTTRKFGGTGLGLTICRRLVQVMGGDIDFKSIPGKGSSFFFTLPLPHTQETPEKPTEITETVRIPEPKATEPHATLTPSPKAKGAEKTILLAEDSKTNQTVVLAMLESFPVNIDLAEDGKKALEKLQENKYDLVLMDVAMPEMDGLAATRAIRILDDEKIRDVPIIALTANAMASDRDICLSAGMNDYLSKPLDKMLLQEKLAFWLGIDIVVEEKKPAAPEISDDSILDKAILQQLSDDTGPEIITTLVKGFIEELDIRLTSIETCLENDNLETLRTEAHTVKGSAATFGVRLLSEKAKTLEFACRDEKKDDIPELAKNVLTTADTAKKALKQHFKLDEA